MKLTKFLIIMTITLFSSIAYSQNEVSNQNIVKKFLNGFNNPEKIQESLDLLSDDYIFKNPMVELHSKMDFISLAKEMGTVITGLELMNVSSNGEWVATFYVFKSKIPGLESNIASEWFRVDNGLIKESHLVYDASEWRKVYEKIENQ